MKRYGKFILLCAMICLIGALILGCGGTGVETDTESVVETEAETEKQSHVHASTAEPVNMVASTCQEKGYADYRCDECLARYREELPIGTHDYREQYDAALGYEVIKCNGCGDWRMEIDGKEERNFAAVCNSNISMSFEVLGAEAKIRFTVDGESFTETYPAGKHTVTVAKGLRTGGHTFGFAIENGGCALDLTDISLNGTMHRPDGVILEMTKTTAGHGGEYNDFFVYVQTSDPSGDYYIRYRFMHSYDTTVTGGTNSANNNNMFRIVAAYLVKVKSVTDTSVDCTEILSLLTAGEVAVAIKEPDTVDFIGGYHGEENITELWMYADDVAYTPGAEKKVVVCSFLEFSQTTVINRCNVPEDKIVQHDQYYRITTNGLNCKRDMTWLVDGFNHSAAYCQMFTLLRKSADKGTPICNIVETFDENGKSLGKEIVDYPLPDENSDKWILQSTDNRSVKYSSETSGISAYVGFTILNDSVVVERAHVSARRDGTGDNKWYASFKSATAGQTSVKGEVWSLDTIYHIDYVAPEA